MLRILAPIVRAFCPVSSPWDEPCSPDDLIAAHVCQSFVKEFDKWTAHTVGFNQVYDANKKSVVTRVLRPLTPLPELRPKGGADEVGTTSCTAFSLSGPGVQMTGEWRALQARERINRGFQTYYYQIEFFSLVINDVPLEDKAGLLILRTYQEVKAAVDKANEAANKAAFQMRVNEQKWNLAETLLGMKRDANGALVPIETPEPVIEGRTWLGN